MKGNVSEILQINILHGYNYGNILPATKNPSYQVTNKTDHCHNENMESCPAYDQIHVHMYDDIQS